tara:strand:+ start:282 stop:677 length:396 start_codon:yes stop_codon:yes gene_type:complete
MIENVEHKGVSYAIIIREDFKTDGIKFFTPQNFSQQLGYMNRPKNYKIQPHIHNSVKRIVKLTNEVLFIKSGKCRVNFYDDDKKYIMSKVLEKGDFMLLAYGGHGFDMLEDTEIIEIKQGPYAGEDDKTRF